MDKFCDCNQGRLPCTCKDPVGAVIAEDAEARRPLTVGERAAKAGTAAHYSMLAEAAGDLARITAERDALQALLNQLDDRLDVMGGLLLEVSNRATLMGWEPGLVQTIDAAIKPDADGTEYNYRTDLRAYFGLSYASWLTIPRVLMEAMPQSWQQRIAVLLNEYSDAYQNQPNYGTSVRITQDGKLIKTPAWLINYRHPDHAMIEQVRGKRCQFPQSCSSACGCKP